MSDLSRPNEALLWCADWLGIHGPAGLLRRLDSVNDHLCNVDACEREGRWPSSWHPDQVRHSVRFLRSVRDALLSGADMTRHDLEVLYLRAGPHDAQVLP